jgi:hypothetical protein
MTEEEAQAEFYHRLGELLQDFWQTNPLSRECRPGLEMRADGDRLVVIGHRKDNGEAVELARFPRSWAVGKSSGT